MGSKAVPPALPPAGTYPCRTTTGLRRTISAHITGDHAVIIAPLPAAELSASEADALGQQLIALARHLRLVESGDVIPIHRNQPGRAG
ncbi:hypothetical protein [Amycolatopsis sp.]|uniref:hypothetical protein n=1 Tax=Amycolatopsis sp. TaxID=37632 RepID=UPI002B6BCF78|nr:hypothetical protein [Amycolatopsis sp.]HVV12091.1 hypothetical protein [Amycolatopsis sp.]